MDHQTKKEIILQPITDASRYLSQILQEEADADFYNDVCHDGNTLCAICDGETVVGLTSICDDADAYIYVYIFPQYRSQGYGSSAVEAAEQRLPGAETFSTAYNSKNEIARKLAQKYGYNAKFASSVMTYPGEKFQLPELPICKHRDEYFAEAYNLSAEAFHIMRLETGHDPNSVPYQATDAIRQHCLETADERYVYMLGDEIVGCAHLDGAEIDNVAIKITHQGKGLGKLFVQYLVNEILDQEIGQPFLFCLVSNQKAWQLYASLGFTETTRNEYATKDGRVTS